ncbi:beta-lactamase [Actinomyces sp. oral taxon 848 str. F0332]|nr:beta-lactamase [Actinomyces sp. oral taxon 848 str. F0332]
MAASLAGLIGLSVAAWGSAASAQADETARSAMASVSTTASASLTSASGASSQQVTVSKYASPSKQASSSRRTGKSKAAQKRDLRATIQELVDAGYPGALAAKTDKDGNAVGATAGKGNLATGEAPPLDGEVRIASNTKTFVAVLIMKMVEEGKVKLDEPIETYLPGIVKGQGVDGKKITVRQLLQHTSGLPEFGDGQLDYFAIRNDYVSPRDVLDGVLSRPAQFAPGAKFQYNNANYVVLGLLAERVAKRPIAEQIDAKIVKPLGLKHTYMPAPGEKTIRGKHPHGYHTRDGKPGKLEDITEADPSWEGAAGSMISTPSELNKFMQSVFDGSLLSQASIAEMKKSVPAPEMGGEYGLGLIAHKSSCGVVWGHSGNNPGYHSLSAVGPDGTAATIVTTAEPAVNAKEAETMTAGKDARSVSALDKTLCGK